MRNTLTRAALACGLLTALSACSPAAQQVSTAPTPTRPLPTWAQASPSTEATAERTALPAVPPNTVDGVFVGDLLPRPLPIQDFTMPGTRSGDLSMSALNGRWRLVFFGYTHCPDFCPLTLAEYKSVKAQLGELAEQVTFVFISVDGARDTAPVLTEYLARFDPEFVGFSGDDATLAQIQPDYGFYYRRRVDTTTSAAYLVDHSTRTYVIDPQGEMVASFTYDTSTSDVASAMRWWIENGSAAAFGG